MKALIGGNISCGVFEYLQKAFDPKDYLLAKLNHYGNRGISNNWSKSYLSNCNHYLSHNEYKSGPAALNWSVSQGSVLGPLLVLLYVNEVNQVKTFCKVYHFADDTNVLSLSNSVKKLNKLVIADLKHLVNWLNTNKFFLNFKKLKL